MSHSSKKKTTTRAKPRYTKSVSQQAGVEHKFFDSSRFGSVPNFDANMDVGLIDPTSSTLISAPSQGDQANNRNGKNIVITTIIIEGLVRWPLYKDVFTAMSVFRTRVWIALIQDTQTNGANFFTADALVNPTGVDVDCVIPLKNLYNAKRFITLKVWEFGHPEHQPVLALNQVGDLEVMMSRATAKWGCYLKVNIPVNFNNFVPTASQVGSVVDNSLHLVAFQDSGHVNLTAFVDYNARIRFVG